MTQNVVEGVGFDDVKCFVFVFVIEFFVFGLFALLIQFVCHVNVNRNREPVIEDVDVVGEMEKF